MINGYRCIGGYEHEVKVDGVSCFNFSLFLVNDEEETYLLESRNYVQALKKITKHEVVKDYERVSRLIRNTDWAENKGNGGYTIIKPLLLEMRA